MNLKLVYAYIRISDKYKQEDGVSLEEQRRILEEYAKVNNLKIIRFYEEKRTAAKKGRPLFEEMMQNLKSGKAQGVIIHKIDRSARNLHDWADIGDLIDMDIDVFFAHESLNMRERGGRLSADIQAVMASDYVRNLRQETLKGLYGRLKQGYYPWRAPIGYVDNGKGKKKTINSEQANLVKKTFNLYVNGNYNVKTLAKEMQKHGLKNKCGGKVCKNGITRILKNPFYTGLMKAKDKVFEGNHEAIISANLFEQAQMKMEGRIKSNGVVKHNYLFRKLIRCSLCNLTMSGEKQKGRVYYRCQTKGCPTKSIREDQIEFQVRNHLKTITLSKDEIRLLREVHEEYKKDEFEYQQKIHQGYIVQYKALKTKEQRLLDIYLEASIDKETYHKQREELLIEIKKIEELISSSSESKQEILEEILKILELCKSPLKMYDSGNIEKKREIIKTMTSNLTGNRKKVGFPKVSPYLELANRDILDFCALNRSTARTMYSKIDHLDNNTNPRIPKPMNKEQIKLFYQFLLGCSKTLLKINTLKNSYEVQTNHANTQ